MVSQRKIPVYGPPYQRRFRTDTLDLYIVDRELAMHRHKEDLVT